MVHDLTGSITAGFRVLQKGKKRNAIPCTNEVGC